MMQKRMKVILSILIVILLSFEAKTQSLSDLEFGTSSTLEIMTWNLENFPKQGQNTIDYVIEIIENLDVDIIALQEIDNPTSFQNLINNLDGWEGYYTNYNFANLAYLYKTDVVEFVDIFEIYVDERRPFPRAPFVLEVNYQGQPYIIINNHLKCCGDGLLDQTDPWDEETRRFSASYLLSQYIQDFYSNDRVVVLGDFNDVLIDNSNHNVFQPFLNEADEYRFADAAIAEGSSSFWSYPNWPSHLDHLLVSNELFDALDHPEASVQTLKIGNYLPNGFWEYDNRVSDHLPVALKINTTTVNVTDSEASTLNFSVTPNPFRETTTLHFDAVTTDAQLSIFNVQGQLVQDFDLDARQSSVLWDAKTAPTGIYYARLRVGEEVMTRKLVRHSF